MLKARSAKEQSLKFYFNKKRFWLQRVENFKLENNTFEQGFDYVLDVKAE